MHKAVMNKINWIYLSWILNIQQVKAQTKKKKNPLEYIKKKWAFMEMLMCSSGLYPDQNICI